MRIRTGKESTRNSRVPIEVSHHYEKWFSSNLISFKNRAVKISNIFHSTLHFVRNFGSDTTKNFYIGPKGDFTAALRDAILITNYELAPNPCDHRLNRLEHASHGIN